jgi:phosphate starvation-inducible PhoH-like protein
LTEITIPLRSHDEAILVLGPYDRFAKLLRQALDIEVYARGGNLCLKGGSVDVEQAKRRIEHLLGKSRKGRQLDLREIEAILAGVGGDARPGGGGPRSQVSSDGSAEHRFGTRPFHTKSRSVVTFRERAIEPRNESQRRYKELMDELPLVFGLGAAGTGKTYLAVSQAVRSMRRGGGASPGDYASRGGSGRAPGLLARRLAAEAQSLHASNLRRSV